MKRLFRRLLWALIRLTDPPALKVLPRQPGETQVRFAERPPQRRIPLPPGTPRHTTVKLNTAPPAPRRDDELPGLKPPEVRRS